MKAGAATVAIRSEIHTVFIPGPLPSLNDLIGAAKGYKGRGTGYSRLKALWTGAIAGHVRKARLPRIEHARLRFHWVEKTTRRDPDNVAGGGRKLVLDGLVVAGVLTDDSWLHVLSWEDTWSKGAKPGVHVIISGEVR